MSRPTDAQKEELNESILESFKNARIPTYLRTKEEHLQKYGKTGMILAEGFSDQSLIQNAKAGVGIHLHGYSGIVHKLMALTIRAFVLHGISAKLFDLPYVEDYVMRVDEDYLEIDRVKVWGIRGFQSDKESSMDAKALFRIGRFLEQAIEDGHVLVISSPMPLKDCPWWGSPLLDLLAEKTISFTVQEDGK